MDGFLTQVLPWILIVGFFWWASIKLAWEKGRGAGLREALRIEDRCAPMARD